MRPTPLLRLEARTAVDASGCWVWQGYRDRHGYGTMSVPGTKSPQRVHRVAYRLFVGPIPVGFVIDHVCRNPGCVNPLHLEAVTQAENVRRGLRGRLTTRCPMGHAYTPANTIRSRRGHRSCRSCKNARERERRKR